MREHLDVDSYANNVRMLRTSFRGPICVVEGDTDRKLYSELLDRTQTRYLCVNGPFVEAVIKNVNATATTGVIGIMDADFCHLENSCPRLENLFLTDYHDLEMLLVFSNAFFKVIQEMGSEEKIRAASGDYGEDPLRKLLLDAASPVGALRWLNKSSKIGLDFENLKFERFVDDVSLVSDRKKVYTMICQRSSRNNHINTVAAEAEKILSNSNLDKRQLCCGHDIVEIMAIALRRLWGTRNASDVSPDRLSAMLRLAYHIQNFQVTKLFSALLKWSKDHPDYHLFATDALTERG